MCAQIPVDGSGARSRALRRMSDTSPRHLDDEQAFNRRFGFYPGGYDSPESSSSSSSSSEWQSVASEADLQDANEEHQRVVTDRWTRVTRVLLRVTFRRRLWAYLGHWLNFVRQRGRQHG